MSETTDALLDLRKRLTDADERLRHLALSSSDQPRLEGKAEGVRLAVSYLDDALRSVR